MDIKAEAARISEKINQRITLRMMARLILSFLAIAVVIFVLILRLSSKFTSSEMEAAALKGDWLADSLSEKGRIGVMVGQQSILEKASSSAEEDPSVVYIIFYNKDRELIYSFFRGAASEGDFDFPELPVSSRAVPREISDITGNMALDMSKAIGAKTIEPSLQEGDTASRDLAEEDIVGWVRVGISTQLMHNINRSIIGIGGWVLFLLLLLGAFISLLLPQMIARPISNMARSAKKFGEGDLDTRIEIETSDEVGQLGNSFNEMAQNIKDQMARTQVLIKRLTESIELISTTAADMYAISAEQSSGATEQAASVYQASSTSKEIAASATRIADTAEEVASYARQTSTASDQGKDELNRAIYQVKDMSQKSREVAERMVELGEKSQKISGIIDIINEISEQTNLLSLNASIEASGAGEAGKRFSVVAQEIRRLAGRTLETTQVVSELIEEIQSATNSAVMVTEQNTKSAEAAQLIIDHMNQSFQNILDMVEQTLKASTEITLSTRQQTTACEQMVSTIMEVSEVASQVEEGAKETERAIERLRELSGELKSLSIDDPDNNQDA